MDGIVREVREELGVEIEVVEGPILLAPHTYGPDGAYVLAIGFSTRIIEGEPNPTDEVAEIRWISMEGGSRWKRSTIQTSPGSTTGGLCRLRSKTRRAPIP